jgi:hypothetical protein
MIVKVMCVSLNHKVTTQTFYIPLNTAYQSSICLLSGVSLFHPSWLLGVYQRMFHSENKSVMREGVDHLLELQVLRRPAFALAFSQVPQSVLKHQPRLQVGLRPAFALAF